ncbi:MAG: glyceraldehyde-3-phosphate dehydrogenase, partial [Methanomicrobiales archaeon HGW-Methanomicrobiales-5]
RIEGSALNVPVPNGSLLDLTAIFKSKDITIEMINNAVQKYADQHPEIVEMMNDPIVSTDVIGNSHSVVFDWDASIKSSGRMIKTLTWYHAAKAMSARIIDLIIAYDKLNAEGGSL